MQVRNQLSKRAEITTGVGSVSDVVKLNDGAPLQRALGTSWDTREDVFLFSSSIKDQTWDTTSDKFPI